MIPFCYYGLKLRLFLGLFADEIEMEKEEATIHDNDDMDNLESDNNFADDNENGMIASTSSIAAGNVNADEHIAASEETNDVKPAVEHALRACHNRQQQKSQKKKPTRPKSKKTKAKRFKCNQCDYTNAYQSGIKSHAQSHSTEKPFQCEQCNTSFGYIANMRTHLLRRHNIIYL